MSELEASGVTGLAAALRNIGLNAVSHYAKYQGKTLGHTFYLYPEEATTFAEVADNIAERFSGHNVQQVWVGSFDPATRQVGIAAVVDLKDWSLRECNGWNMGETFTEETGTNMNTFINESENEFSDISSEAERIYNFGQKGFVKIKRPLKLSVSASGGHRIFSEDGTSHYVPGGWIQLTWTPREGQPNFVK